MDIVTAGVHHRHGCAGVSLGRDLAGVLQTRLFFHRQGVHVGAQHHRWPFTVVHDGDDTGLAHAGRDLVPECLQHIRQLSCGLLLVHRQLGMLMQIKVERIDLRVNGGNLIGRGYGCAAGLRARLRSDQQKCEQPDFDVAMHELLLEKPASILLYGESPGYDTASEGTQLTCFHCV